MPEQRKLAIQINGIKYPITTLEETDYVEGLAREMDKSVRQLMGGSQASVTEALVLLSLSYLDAYKKSETTSDNLRSQIAEYLEEAARARSEAVEARRELTRLEALVDDKAGSKEVAKK